MSSTKKLTLSAMIAAICVICMALGSVLPQMRLPMAALAGLFPAAAVLACGYGWAAGVFGAASALALLLLGDKTAAVWFLCFFGHYPVWKALIESLQTRLKQPWLGWLLKVPGFALCMALLYLAFGGLFAAAIPYPFTEYTAGPYILAIALLLAFVLYDLAFSILIDWFRQNVLPKMK